MKFEHFLLIKKQQININDVGKNAQLLLNSRSKKKTNNLLFIIFQVLNFLKYILRLLLPKEKQNPDFHLK